MDVRDKIQVTFMFEDFDSGLANLTQISLPMPTFKDEREELGSHVEVVRGASVIFGIAITLIILFQTDPQMLIVLYSLLNSVVVICLTNNMLPPNVLFYAQQLQNIASLHFDFWSFDKWFGDALDPPSDDSIFTA